MASPNDGLIWEIRAFVYDHFTRTTRAPSVNETAAQFDLTREQAAAAFEELHRRHAFFLRPDTHEILMANPFSGIATQFKVRANERTYFANCAWDSLGIPAALHMDAQIEAACSQTGEPIQLSIRNGTVSNSDAPVHFLVPFREWYNDLVFT